MKPAHKPLLDGQTIDIIYKADYKGKVFSWKSPMMMPEKYSRYHLKLTKIMPQRINEISEEDCMAEGITRHLASQMGISVSPSEEEFNFTQIKSIFRRLWDSINLKTGHGWEKNEWVWALYYDVILKNKEVI